MQETLAQSLCCVVSKNITIARMFWTQWKFKMENENRTVHDYEVVPLQLNFNFKQLQHFHQRVRRNRITDFVPHSSFVLSAILHVLRTSPSWFWITSNSDVWTLDHTNDSDPTANIVSSIPTLGTEITSFAQSWSRTESSWVVRSLPKSSEVMQSHFEPSIVGLNRSRTHLPELVPKLLESDRSRFRMFANFICH